MPIEKYNNLTNTEKAEKKYIYGHTGQEVIRLLQNGSVLESQSLEVELVRQYRNKKHFDIVNFLKTPETSFQRNTINIPEEHIFITLELLRLEQFDKFAKEYPLSVEKLLNNPFFAYVYYINGYDKHQNIQPDMQNTSQILCECLYFGPEKYHGIVSNLIEQNPTLLTKDLIEAIASDESLKNIMYSILHGSRDLYSDHQRFYQKITNAEILAVLLTEDHIQLSQMEKCAAFSRLHQLDSEQAETIFKHNLVLRNTIAEGIDKRYFNNQSSMFISYLINHTSTLDVITNLILKYSWFKEELLENHLEDAIAISKDSPNIISLIDILQKIDASKMTDNSELMEIITITEFTNEQQQRLIDTNPDVIYQLFDTGNIALNIVNSQLLIPQLTAEHLQDRLTPINHAALIWQPKFAERIDQEPDFQKFYFNYFNEKNWESFAIVQKKAVLTFLKKHHDKFDIKLLLEKLEMIAVKIKQMIWQDKRDEVIEQFERETIPLVENLCQRKYVSASTKSKSLLNENMFFFVDDYEKNKIDITQYPALAIFVKEREKQQLEDEFPGFCLM